MKVKSRCTGFKKSRLAFLLLCAVIYSDSASSQKVHGPSAKYSYSDLEQHAFGIGYHFMSPKDDWWWTRPGHNYYIEYIPAFKAIGVSANVQYVFLFFKAGMEVSFRSKNEQANSYFLFYPNVGLELLRLDLSFGPDITSQKIAGERVGFKFNIKVHPFWIKKSPGRFNIRRNKKATGDGN